MAVLDDALSAMKKRLAEIEQQISPLAAEAEQLRQAITGLQRAAGERVPRARGTARTEAGGREAAAATAGSTQPAKPRARRAPGKQAATATAPGASRDRNGDQVLAAITTEAKTAGQVAKETGIARGTVAATLTRLVSEGAATKAARGYRAV